MKNLILTAVAGLLLGGCAGSANHKIVTAYEAKDVELSCSDIDSEINKAQEVIDEVNKDKSDVSGADVVDAVLWFPFNLIAKSANYNKALEAADKRIARLSELRKEKGC